MYDVSQLQAGSAAGSKMPLSPRLTTSLDLAKTCLGRVDNLKGRLFGFGLTKGETSNGLKAVAEDSVDNTATDLLDALQRLDVELQALQDRV